MLHYLVNLRVQGMRGSAPYDLLSLYLMIRLTAQSRKHMKPQPRAKKSASRQVIAASRICLLGQAAA